MIQLQVRVFNNKDKLIHPEDQVWIINNMMTEVNLPNKTNSVEEIIDKTSLTNNNQETSTNMDNLTDHDSLY